MSPGMSQAPPLGSSHVDATCVDVGQETRPLPCAASATAQASDAQSAQRTKRGLYFHQPEAGLEPFRIPKDTGFIVPMQE